MAAQILLWTTAWPVLVMGCQPSGGRVPLSGEIQVDGDTEPSGVLHFSPVPGQKGPSAMVDALSGRFTCSRYDGPLPGLHTVEFLPAIVKAPEATADAAEPPQYQTQCQVPVRPPFEVQLRFGESTR